MKCANCEKDAAARDRTTGRCPGCNHPFTADPPVDGITDMYLKHAVDRVSAGGTFKFLKQHIYYEVLRRQMSGRTGRRILDFVFLTAGAGLFWAALKYGEGWWIAASIVTFIGGVGFLMHLAGPKREHIATVVQRFLENNPNPNLVASIGQRGGTPAPKPDLGEVSFDRLLLCDRPEYVDFFLANEFHFHYACPVLGDRQHPAGVFADLMERVKKNPKLQVYVLHDYSPAGMDFVKRVRNDTEWFPEHPADKIIDGGLSRHDQTIFKKLAENERAELTVMRPEALIAAAGRGVVEGLPLREARAAAGVDDTGTG